MSASSLWLFLTLTAGAGACASAPAEKPLPEEKGPPAPMGRVLTDMDLYLRLWSNSALADPNERSEKQAQAAERAIEAEVKKRFDEFAAQLDGGARRNQVITAAALGFCKEPRALPYLVRSLSRSDPEIVGNALLGLGVLASPETPLPPVQELLAHHPSPAVRSQAAFALKRLVDSGVRDEALPPTLRAALRDSEPGVRAQAAAALGGLRDRDSIEPLISLLQDSTPLIAAASAYALGRIKDPQAVDALTLALESPSPRIREAAHRALVEITGEDRGSTAWDWKKPKSP